MSYRKDRDKILKTSPEDFDQYFDYFFEKLLNIRRAICLNDYSILQDSYFVPEFHFDTLCTPEEQEYFHRKPLTLLGAQEYHNLYLSKIQPFYKELEKTLDEAIEEDGRGFTKEKKQEPKETVPLSSNIEIHPPDEICMGESERKQTEKILNGEFNDIVSAPVNQHSHTYKEGRSHIPKLFRYYLKCLIEHTMNKLTDEDWGFIRRDSSFTMQEFHEKSRGRKSIAFEVTLFYFIDQINENEPNDSYEGMMPSLVKEGYVKKTTRCTSMIKYRDLESTSLILKRMIELSARPFNRYEHIFAVDGTGLNCVTKNDYYADKHHKTKERDWCELHAICGIKSNIITSAVVNHKYKTDETVEVIPLIERTLTNFKIDYVLGDGGYLDEKSMVKASQQYDVKIFCPIKSNTVINPKGKSEEWNENIRANLSDEWEKFYHKRSNIETSFSALKKRLGEGIYHSKKENSRINEVYCKIVIYNICHLIVYGNMADIMPRWEEIDYEVIDRLIKGESYKEIMAEKTSEKKPNSKI